jgi:2-oxoisovalerate dehydrogenase E1 component alpha subunit
VTRLTGHSSDDQQTKYRSEEELESDKARDPLPRFRAQLQDAGILTDDVLAKLVTDITAAVDDATSYAESQPDPDPSTAMRWVYAEEWPGETPPPWGFTLRGTGGH